jgi:predicted ATP-grasp superfamily ATP-dependent carboligase
MAGKVIRFDPSTEESGGHVELGSAHCAQTSGLAAGKTVTGRTSALPVVVLAGGVTALGVMRSFGRRGIETYVYPGASDYIRFSRWYRPLLKGEGPTAGRPTAASLREALERSGLERGFLCACSDDWNQAVAAYAESAEPRFLSVVPRTSALARLQDKGGLARLLEELKVPRPMTRLVHGADDVSDLPQSTETFYFLKPTDSQRFLAHFGTKGMRVPNAAEAQRRLSEIAAAGMSVVLQEYIPGSFTEHYFVDGYVSRRGEIKGLFARRRLRIYPPDFGNSTAMVSVALDDVSQAVDSVRRVLGAVSYQGIFSAEFKRDPRDGLYKLLEVNTRPWWFVDFAVRCGVDVCRMAYEDAQGVAVTSVEQYRVGATCVFPYYDYCAVQPMLRAGAMKWGQWAREIAPALQPVGCWDDPLPGLVAFSRVMYSAVRNRLHPPTTTGR